MDREEERAIKAAAKKKEKDEEKAKKAGEKEKAKREAEGEADGDTKEPEKAPAADPGAEEKKVAKKVCLSAQHPSRGRTVHRSDESEKLNGLAGQTILRVPSFFFLQQFTIAMPTASYLWWGGGGASLEWVTFPFFLVPFFTFLSKDH